MSLNTAFTYITDCLGCEQVNVFDDSKGALSKFGFPFEDPLCPDFIIYRVWRVRLDHKKDKSSRERERGLVETANKSMFVNKRSP